MLLRLTTRPCLFCLVAAAGLGGGCTDERHSAAGHSAGDAAGRRETGGGEPATAHDAAGAVDAKAEDTDGRADAAECVPGPVDPDAPVDRRWVRVCPGEFVMGVQDPWPYPGWPPDAWSDCKPHRVAITRPFLIRATEVTLAEWLEVMACNPFEDECDWQGGGCWEPAGNTYPEADCWHCPAVCVGWIEVTRFCNELSRRDGLPECYGLTAVDDRAPWPARRGFPSWPEGLACTGYRLPTEAEWEYAARAGSQTRFPAGDDESALARTAWYQPNAGGRVHTVAQREPNAWGLYDSLGNALEVVWDWYSEDYGGHEGLDSVVVDPTGPPGPVGPWTRDRCEKGCSRARNVHECLPGYREFFKMEDYSLDVGFRIARSLP